MVYTGFCLYAVGLTGAYTTPVSFLHIMIFSSVISAVDPVAVLVVFEELHVDKNLYIAVFGESLLNDAVSVVWAYNMWHADYQRVQVLYNIFLSFSEIGASNIIAVDVLAGVGSFFVIAFGGVLVGMVFAVITAFSTR